MKKNFLLWMAVFFLTACGGNNNEDEPTLPVANAPITILSYLVADNNLDDYLIYNIVTMYEGMTEMKQTADLLVYWDGSSKIQGYEDPVILRYKADGKGKVNGQSPLLDASLKNVLALAEIVKQYPSQLSTDKGVMSQVLTDMVNLSTAEKVGLIAGSHGSAWLNSIFTNSSRSFGQDGWGTDNTILISDMAEAMKSTGKIFDFLLFDACLMSTGEVLYDLRNVTNYQIASVLEIPAYGFPYDLLMTDLFNGSVDGYKKACKSFVDYYENRYNKGDKAWATISLIDSRQVENLAAEVKSEILAHKDMLSEFSPKGLQEYGWAPATYISVDMEQFIKVINDGSLPSSFQNQLAKTVVYKDGLDNSRYYSSGYDLDMSNYCGIGMYVPMEGYDSWNSCFKTVEWYSVVGWDQVSFNWNF